MYDIDDEEEEEEQARHRVPAGIRLMQVEKNFYASLTCSRFKYQPAKPGLRSWSFFAAFAVAWVVFAIAYVYTSISYKKIWVVLLGLAFLVCLALGGLFLIRGVIFYYYDMYVSRVGDNVVILLYSKWNKDVTVYFSHDRILRIHRGSVEDRREYAYQYVGTHLLFNKFKAEAKYVANTQETITAFSNDGGTARMRIVHDMPASITFAPPPNLRSEFGAIKYLRLEENDVSSLPAVPEALVRACNKRGWVLPDNICIIYSDEEA